VLVVRILREILGSLPGGTDLTSDDKLLDLGTTSFQLMQVLIAVERAFAVELPDSALRLETFESAGSIAAVVDSLTSEQPAT
jgi:acyl carrier protein